jgi:Zn finger protein HypA/HybF involved in hydrogenase expression
MDAVILFDHKNYVYSCESCDWVGTEVELDLVTKIDMNLVCCPHCKNDDVRVVNELPKVV